MSAHSRGMVRCSSHSHERTIQFSGIICPCTMPGWEDGINYSAPPTSERSSYLEYFRCGHETGQCRRKCGSEASRIDERSKYRHQFDDFKRIVQTVFTMWRRTMQKCLRSIERVTYIACCISGNRSPSDHRHQHIRQRRNHNGQNCAFRYRR